MAPKVALILGYGPRVGTAVAAKLASAGYSVAVVSRTSKQEKTPEGYVSIAADLSKPSAVGPVFKTVSSKLGSAPSVVVYNAAAVSFPPDENSAFSVSVDSFINDLNVNTVVPYAVAQEAVKGFDTLKTGRFIYTGNGLNTTVVPMGLFLTLGVGKSGSSYWVGAADALYASKGYRFFYADERKADGGMASMELDGPAHGEFYLQLADGETKDIPSQATFVKGKGYVKF